MAGRIIDCAEMSYTITSDSPNDLPQQNTEHEKAAIIDVDILSEDELAIC